jgi:carbon monoxide dehydrogenase subunit G
VLADAGTFASCLPGDGLRAADGVHVGRVTFSANGHPFACDATLRQIDQDDDEHVATIAAHGRQLDGVAIGSATLRSRLEAADGSTRVRLTAELSSSGHSETVDSAAREVLDGLAERLAERVLTQREPEPARPPAAGTRAVPAVKERGQPLVVAAGVLLALAILRRALGRRRRAG